MRASYPEASVLVNSIRISRRHAFRQQLGGVYHQKYQDARRVLMMALPFASDQAPIGTGTFGFTKSWLYENKRLPRCQQFTPASRKN